MISKNMTVSRTLIYREHGQVIENFSYREKDFDSLGFIVLDNKCFFLENKYISKILIQEFRNIRVLTRGPSVTARNSDKILTSFFFYQFLTTFWPLSSRDGTKDINIELMYADKRPHKISCIMTERKSMKLLTTLLDTTICIKLNHIRMMNKFIDQLKVVV